MIVEHEAEDDDVADGLVLQRRRHDPKQQCLKFVTLHKPTRKVREGERERKSERERERER